MASDLIDKDQALEMLRAAIAADGGTQKEYAERRGLRPSLISMTLGGMRLTPQMLDALGLDEVPMYRVRERASG